MISFLKGILSHKSPTEAVLDVHGVGYAVSIPLSTYEVIGDVNSEVMLYTHLNVRDDALQLFGFCSEEERSVFRLLLSVNGIGPKMAQGILSGASVHDLRTYLVNSNLKALEAVPGIGRKIAERLVVELREKITRLDIPAASTTSAKEKDIRMEALMALTSLGYSRPAADKALREAMRQLGDNGTTVENLIKIALQYATK